jgi:hypothetical protein
MAEQQRQQKSPKGWVAGEVGVISCVLFLRGASCVVMEKRGFRRDGPTNSRVTEIGQLPFDRKTHK